LTARPTVVAARLASPSSCLTNQSCNNDLRREQVAGLAARPISANERSDAHTEMSGKPSRLTDTIAHQINVDAVDCTVCCTIMLNVTMWPDRFVFLPTTPCSAPVVQRFQPSRIRSVSPKATSSPTAPPPVLANLITFLAL